MTATEVSIEEGVCFYCNLPYGEEHTTVIPVEFVEGDFSDGSSEFDDWFDRDDPDFTPVINVEIEYCPRCEDKIQGSESDVKQYLLDNYFID